MKTLKIFSTAILILLAAQLSFAQKTTSKTFKVSGECGMCKKKIEKAAKDAGATYAVWSTQSKILTVRYNSLSTNTAKIEQKIAGVGYDTPDYKATDKAYNKLDACCQYDREGSGAHEAKSKGKSCCNKGSAGCEKGSAEKMSARTTGSDGDCCKKDGKTTMNCGSDAKTTSTTKKAQQ